MDELRDALGDIREFMGRHDAKLEGIHEQLARQNGRVGKLEEAHAEINMRVAEVKGTWKAIMAISALIGSGVAWAAKHFLPLLFVVAAYSQTAVISDTLYNAPGGALWTGRIVVTLNTPGSAQPLYSGTTSLAGFSLTLCVGVTGGDCTTSTAAGIVTATLYTNSAITPAGTSYNARYTPTRGGAWAETWVVSTGNTKIYQIRSTTVPSPTVMFAPGQVTPGSNGQCLTTSGGAATWGSCASGTVTEYTGSSAIDLPSIPDGTCHLSTTAITVTNAALGFRAGVGLSVALPEGVTARAVVIGPNSMKVELCNHTGAAYDPASITYTLGSIT